MSAELSLLTPPPGLEPHTAFTLREIAGAAGLYALQASEDPGLRMFVLDAAVYLPDYTPTLSDEQCDALGLTAPEQALLLVVATTDDEGTTVNLMAPVVANADTGVAAQLILEHEEWPLRHALTSRTA